MREREDGKEETKKLEVVRGGGRGRGGEGEGEGEEWKERRVGVVEREDRRDREGRKRGKRQRGGMETKIVSTVYTLTICSVPQQVGVVQTSP